jgi:oligosaccharide repeat unit polymerase
MNYIEISDFTWLIITYCYGTFVLGVITVYVAKKNFSFPPIEDSSPSFLLRDNAKILQILVYFFCIIGLISAIQHWYVLIAKFGDIRTVLIQANLVYRLRTDGEVSGVLPYLYISSYIAVVLSGIYTAVRKKITLVAIISFLSIIVKEIASFGRAGILTGLLLFVISFILFRHYLTDKNTTMIKKIGKKEVVILFTVMSILFFAGITVVKSFRGTYESFKATSKSLSKLRNNDIISPSIYLYASAHVAVLSKYFEQDDEKAKFGENTFLPIYNFISKFGVVEHPDFYQRGYWIPMWTNTGTYIREIHADFGILGIIFFPFILGFFTTIFWYRFLEKGKMIDFIVLVYLYLIISMSFLVMITRSATWFISFLSLVIILKILEIFYRGSKLNGIKDNDNNYLNVR